MATACGMRANCLVQLASRVAFRWFAGAGGRRGAGDQADDQGRRPGKRPGSTEQEAGDQATDCLRFKGKSE